MSIISGIIYSYIGMIISPNVPYWNNRNIHNLGNTGALGNLHAMTAPIMTKFIDRAAYGGRNIREEVYNTFEGDVLDMCCGTGFSTKPGSVGIDTSLEMLRFSKIFNPGSEYLYGNAERFGKDDEFDVVSIMFAFHEMPTSAHQKIIRNAIRVARKKVVVVDISKDYKPSRGMLAGEPYLLNYLDNFEKTIERTPFEYPLYYKTRNKLDGVNKTTLVENHVDMWEYTMKDFDDEEPRDLEDSAPIPIVNEPISNSEMTRKKFAREMYRLGGGGGWESLKSLDDLTAKRRKKASKRLKEKKRQSIKWEEQVENKQMKNWAGKSGVYIYKGDGNYEVTPHPLRREREENERLNKKNNQTSEQKYWENIATNMIDENKRRADDYSYKNKAEYSMKTNWYYRPEEDEDKDWYCL
ncbi:MAG: hypothetical protein CMJ52_07970 [Planctomycetaceae bacterium]|nr:hypothetical protein [Planctomycetaceae bacterium]